MTPPVSSLMVCFLDFDFFTLFFWIWTLFGIVILLLCFLVLSTLLSLFSWSFFVSPGFGVIKARFLFTLVLPPVCLRLGPPLSVFPSRDSNHSKMSTTFLESYLVYHKEPH